MTTLLMDPTLESNRMTTIDKPQERHQKSASIESAIVCSSSNLGSCYKAPEALKVVKPSQKWDVYSYGVILLEMITGRLPIVQVGSTEMDLVHWIQLYIDDKKPLLDVLDPHLMQDVGMEEEIIAVLKIAMACVHSSPERRPILRHISEVLDRLATSAV